MDKILYTVSSLHYMKHKDKPHLPYHGDKCLGDSEFNASTFVKVLNSMILVHLRQVVNNLINGNGSFSVDARIVSSTNHPEYFVQCTCADEAFHT